MKFFKNIICLRKPATKEGPESDMSMLEFYDANQPAYETEYEAKCGVAQMVQQSARTLEILKIQTACCRAEIENLRSEVRELRAETMINQSAESTDTGFSGSNGFDSICNRSESYSPVSWNDDVITHVTSSSNGDSIDYEPIEGIKPLRRQMSSARINLRKAEANINQKLIQAIEEVSKKIPKFIDFPTEV